MIHHLMAIRDEAVGAFQLPFFVRSTGEATRGFSDAVNNPETPFYKHSKDFTLWMLGTFDDNAGTFDIPPSPELVVLGMNLKNKA